MSPYRAPPTASLLPPPLGPVPISQRSPAAFAIAPRSQPPLSRLPSRYIATGTPRLCTAHRGHNTIIHARSGDHDQSFTNLSTYFHVIHPFDNHPNLRCYENQQPYNSLGHNKPTSSLPLLRSFAPGSWRRYASQNNRILCSRRSRDIAGNALQRQGGDYRER